MNDAYSEDKYPLKKETEEIISAAIDVHKELGPGYLEQIYENALIIELEARGHKVERQVVVEVKYKGKKIGQHRLDMLVDCLIVLELKSVEALASTHIAQLKSTLKASGKRVGLLMNFNQETLTKGLKRVIN